MNAAFHQFDWRTVPCDCDAGKVYEHDAIGIRAVTCPTCDGRKVVDASCDGCDKVRPLDGDNLCQRCAEPAQFTETVSDPLRHVEGEAA